jgi:hypothetical protein
MNNQHSNWQVNWGRLNRVPMHLCHSPGGIHGRRHGYNGPPSQPGVHACCATAAAVMDAMDHMTPFLKSVCTRGGWRNIIASHIVFLALFFILSIVSIVSIVPVAQRFLAWMPMDALRAEWTQSRPCITVIHSVRRRRRVQPRLGSESRNVRVAPRQPAVTIPRRPSHLSPLGSRSLPAGRYARPLRR